MAIAKRVLKIIQAISIDIVFLCFFCYCNTAICASSINQNKTHWITIFVHGMMSIKYHLCLDNFVRFSTDNVRNSLYAKTVEIMRENPFFFKNQAMQHIGLQPVNKHDKTPGNAAAAMAMLFDYLFSICSQEQTINHYYTFGWSGLLSATERYNDSALFLNALLQEIALFKKNNIQPKIRIVGYSHGANVSLNLAAAQQAIQPSEPLEIEELFLIGAPIQRETDFLIHNSMFKKIYNVYSHADRVQQMDVFSSQTLFSNRCFLPRTNFQVPEKVKQIELRVTRFSKPVKRDPIRKALASDLSHYGILSSKSRLLRTMAPGHAELWFFGWTPLNYRKNSPLYPLPAMSLVPFIRKYYQDPNIDQKNMVVFDVRPEIETIIIQDKRDSCKYDVLPFLTMCQQNHITERLLAQAPDNYFDKTYTNHIKQAFEQAKVILQLNDKKCGKKKKK